MSCRVHRDTKTVTVGGKESQLFNNIKKIPTLSFDGALRYYAATQGDTFKLWYGKGKRDVNNEPILDKNFFINDKGVKVHVMNLKPSDIYESRVPEDWVNELFADQKLYNTEVYIDVMEQQIERTYTAISAINSKINFEQDADNKKFFQKEKARLQTTLNIFNKKLFVVKNIPENRLTANEVRSAAKYDFSIAEAILKRGKLASAAEIQSVETLIDFWSTMGTIDGSAVHPFIGPINRDDLLNDNLENHTRLFNELREVAETLQRKLNSLNLAYIQQYSEGVLNKPLTVEDDLNNSKDVDIVNANLKDTGKLANVYAQFTDGFIKAVNITTQDDLHQRLAKIKELTKGLKQKDFDKMQERDRQGRVTGNLTTHLRPEWYEKKEKEERPFTRQADEDDKSRFSTRKHKDYQKHIRDTEHVLRTDLLAEFYNATVTGDVALANRKKEEFGRTWEEFKSAGVYTEEEAQKIFEDAYARVHNYYEEFLIQDEMDREILESIPDPVEREAMKQGLEETRAKAVWVDSPWAYAAYIHGKSQAFNFNDPTKGYEFPTGWRHSIPKDQSMINPDFATVRDNKQLNDLYNFFIDLNHQIKEFAPSYLQRDMKHNFLPTITKTTLRNMRDLRSWIGKGVDEFIKEIGETESEPRINPLTQKIEPRLKLNLMTPSKQEINNRIQIEMIADPSLSIDDARVKVNRDIAEDSSFDLVKILNLLTYNVASYQHKATHEPIARALSNITQNKGKFKIDPNGKITTSGPLSNLSEMINNQLFNVYWGLKTEKSFGDVVKKAKTQRGKKLEKEIDHLLSTNTFTPEDVEKLKKIKEDEKVPIRINGVLKGILRYAHFRAMSWNVFSGVATMMYGTLANWAEGGRLYSEAGAIRGLQAALHSVKRSVPIGSWKKYDADRARALAVRWGFVSRTINEVLKEASKDSGTRTMMDRIKPMAIQNSAEYVSQIPVLIATFHDTEIVTAAGIITLLDGYDDQGNWQTDIYGPEPIAERKKALRKAIAARDKIHGNYDPDAPIMMSNYMLGKLVLMFRRWMIEGFATRFENRKYLDALDKEVTGRYRTIGGTVFGSTNRPMKLDRNGNVMTRGGEPIQMGRVQFMGVVGKQIAYRFLRIFGGRFKENVFEKYAGTGKFSQADAENMLVNVKEFILWGMLTTMTMILKDFYEDEDEEKKKQVYAILLNQLGRIGTDFTLYFNPNEFEKLNKSFIPAWDAVKNIVIDIPHSLWMMKEGRGYIEHGVFAGDHRLTRDIAQALPLGVQLYRYKSMSQQLFDK